MTETEKAERRDGAPLAKHPEAADAYVRAKVASGRPAEDRRQSVG